MKLNKVKLIVLIDNDPVNNAINLSLLRSINIENQLIVCKDGKEAIKIIEGINQELDKFPDIIYLDLNKSSSGKSIFLEVFNTLSNSKNISKVIVISTPDFNDASTTTTLSDALIRNNSFSEQVDVAAPDLTKILPVTDFQDYHFIPGIKSEQTSPEINEKINIKTLPFDFNKNPLAENESSEPTPPIKSHILDSPEEYKEPRADSVKY